MINDLLKSVSTIYIAYGVTDFRKQIYRKNLKTANCILEDIPKVKEIIKIKKQMKLEQMEVTKTKKKNRNLSR